MSIKKIFIKSLISTVIMSIFILYFDLNLETWVNLNLLDRLINLFSIIISATVIYFMLLIIFGIFPKKLIINK